MAGIYQQKKTERESSMRTELRWTTQLGKEKEVHPKKHGE